MGELARSALLTESISLQSIPLPKHAAEAGVQEGDFYSMGDYWWPDPESADGLPYIRRDGESNPSNFDAHRLLMRQMRDQVAALAAGYLLEHDPAMAVRALEALHIFFVDPKTRMNPHLLFAQAIPGITVGRGIGIIDTLHLIEVIPALEVISVESNLPRGEIEAVEDWFRDYLTWLRSHPNGLDEGKTPNNHSVAYWLQVAVFARAVGDQSSLVEARKQWAEWMMPDQMALNGSFPRELERTKPYGYSIFQLDNVVLLSEILSDDENDLWSFSLPDGRSLEGALSFMYPFIEDKSRWPYTVDVSHFDAWPVRGAGLLFGGVRLKQTAYLELWKRLESDPEDLEVRRNVAITQPVLWLRTD